MTDPASFRVNIAISEMDLRTGVWRPAARLATDEVNDGQAAVIIPEIFSQSTLDEVRPMAMEVSIASTPNVGETSPPGGMPTEAPPTGISGALQNMVGEVKRWSSVTFYSDTDRLLTPCQRWCNDQPEGIGREILDRLPPCPRTVEQARSPNSGFREDSGIARFLSQNFFHRGADTCFRQTTFDE